jgi:uncharacterized protein with NRDE domain
MIALMCLVLFSYRPGTARPLVVAANRDEFYARPAAGAHHWEDVPEIFAGRDLSAGGSWLGVTTGGRFCTVTNFAEETPDETAPRSRGKLVEDMARTTKASTCSSTMASVWPTPRIAASRKT